MSVSGGKGTAPYAAQAGIAPTTEAASSAAPNSRHRTSQAYRLDRRPLSFSLFNDYILTVFYVSDSILDMTELPVLSLVDDQRPIACCAVDSAQLEDARANDLASAFKALSDPTRVRMINLMARAGEQCVCVMNTSFDLSQPTISHHLKLLREAGLVRVRRRGTWAYYRINTERLAELNAALAATPAHIQTEVSA